MRRASSRRCSPSMWSSAATRVAHCVSSRPTGADRGIQDVERRVLVRCLDGGPLIDHQDVGRGQLQHLDTGSRGIERARWRGIDDRGVGTLTELIAELRDRILLAPGEGFQVHHEDQRTATPNRDDRVRLGGGAALHRPTHECQVIAQMGNNAPLRLQNT